MSSASRYADVYRRSIDAPEAFWAEAARAIDWARPFDRVLDDSRAPFTAWFPGGELNACYNALDRHVAGGRADQVALIYDSPVTRTVKTYSFRALRDAAAQVAGALVASGVGKGDRVLIYMPMVPETAIAMLACARIGAIHSVVFGGFASPELATRIDDAKPTLILAASCGIEVNRIVEYKPLLDRAIELAQHKPKMCVVLQRPECRAALAEGRDRDWLAWAAAARPVDCVPVRATDPLYVLYTSGTTGIPKGVVHDTGGYLVALAWSMKNVYGVDPGDVFWAASDLGWAVGHSYIVYGPLVYGCTTVLFEGKPVGAPDAGVYWRVIAQHGVKVLFTAPTAFRAIKREDPNGVLVTRHDLKRFRTLFLAGERSDPDTLQWAETQLKVPVIDHWWQTESGWPMAANCMGLGPLPVKHGSPTKAVPGYQVVALDDAGHEVPRGQIGNICVRLPLPPGCLPTLWNNDEGFRRAYMTDFPGYYKTGDAGFVDSDDYLWIMGRTDDIINVAGHRLSTGGMEEVLSAHPDVAECAVIGAADAIKGQVPIGFLVLKSGVDRPHPEIAAEVVRMVRERIGPVAAFRTAMVVQRLPKTRSGKILRGTMQKIADGQAYRMPATIDDPAILGEIATALGAIGYPDKGD